MSIHVQLKTVENSFRKDYVSRMSGIDLSSAAKDVIVGRYIIGRQIIRHFSEGWILSHASSWLVDCRSLGN